MPERFAWGAGLSSLLCLVGSCSGVTILAAWLPGFPAIVPMSALTLFLGALALFFGRPGRGPGALLTGRILSATVLVLAGSTLLGYLIDGFPQPILLKEFVVQNKSALYGGRMSPNTSLLLVCTGLTLLLQSWARLRPRFWILFQSLLGIPATLSVLAMIGIVYQFTGLFPLNSSQVGLSFPNALTQFLLSSGALFLDRERGLARLLVQKNAAGLFLRRFTLIGFFFPFLSAGLIRWTEMQGWLDPSLGTAFFVVLTVLALLTLAVLTAGSIEESEEARVRFEIQHTKLIESQIRQRQVENLTEKLNRALLVGGMATWERDLNSGAVTTSDNYFRLFGLPKPLALWNYRTFVECVDPNHRDFVLETIGRVQRGEEKSYAIEFQSLWPDGSRHWLAGRGEGVRDASGKVVGLRGAVLDIHQLKQTEQALQEAKNRAEAANEMKSAFLSNVSHEIRTPMAAILGFTELLRDAAVSETDREDFIARIERSGRNLLKLIDDILDISKIDAGPLPLEKTCFSPQELVEEVVSMMSVQASAKGLSLQVRTEPGTPPEIESDINRLRQILINILGNAVKFTAQGQVLVRLRPGRRRGAITFEVQDTGIGIAEQDQGRLFQPFAQADGSITRRFGGTGLGLALSRRLAERLGGSLVLLKSAPNEGTTFAIEIDAGLVAPSSSHPASERPLVAALPRLREGARILVAEDSPDNQLLIRKYLSASPVQIEVVGDGAQAVDRIRREPFDLVLMDLQMPVLDGLSATQRIRQEGWQTPILALSAHALPEDIVRSKEAGCDEHLTKPLTREQLILALEKYIGESSPHRL